MLVEQTKKIAYNNAIDTKYFSISFNLIEYEQTYFNINLFALSVKKHLSNLHKVEYIYIICYDMKEVIFVRNDSMTAKFTIEIPYGERENYIDFVIAINRLLPIDDVCALLVNNNPYNLEAYLVIETKAKTEEIKTLVQKYKLKNITEKGLEEFAEEMLYRKWNLKILNPNDDDDVKLSFKKCFFLNSKSAMEKKGYDFNTNIYKPKVFISYSHKDKDIVYNVLEQMETVGINAWIDKRCIDIGDSILKSVSQGIKDCDLHIPFLSKSTINSAFANFELETLMSSKINNKIKWFIVRLDDVKVDDIISGLSNFLYYDFDINNTDELITLIQKSITKIIEQKG